MNMNDRRPTSRGERRLAHQFRASLAHTHNVPSRRKPGMTVDVRCTRADCRHDERRGAR
jgi:hypothetical protein